MSRIQQILDKAAREGVTRRTTTALDGAPPLGVAAPVPIAAGRASDHGQAPARDAYEFPSVQGFGGADAARAGERTAPGLRLDPSVVAAVAPESAAAERFRAIRARLLRREATTPLRALLVTSPGPGEGKTLTAVNLAFTMGQELQRRVLLVDADLRRPRVHTLLGLPPGPGLVDVLTGATPLDAALVDFPEHRLTVLTVGSSPAHHLDLVGSAPMRRLLDTLRARFDRIVVDTPPAADVADAAALAPMVDGVLMVVRAGKTTSPDVERTLASFERSRIAGFVLNESDGVEATAGAYGYAR